MPKRKNKKTRNIVKKEPAKQQASVVSSKSIEVTAWKGPIPPPAILEEYEAALPGAADRIISMIAEKQAAHRMALEALVIGGDSQRSRLGIIFGFIITLAALGGAVFLIYNDKNVAGLILATTAIVGLVSAFVYGTNARRAERSQKASNMPQVRNPQP